ncbi:ribonuclease HIII [Pseudalkalibacillus caeni]|uniref:Ribonuclease HIII n=1 Tax=Exobacillus caeni TaxID=2574798 RepID=A0A5R9FA92_9BACL|nr:ribonuclease HIII [Pseudalkalibacillus caeni]TLS39170.1 ribonuclease HIII [Pseudalkalibacillus caeni]
MSHVVLNVSQSIMNEMKENYNQFKQDKHPPGSLFAAKVPGCTITAYNSGKVLFQGKSAEEESGKWGKSSVSSKPKAKPSIKEPTKYSPPADIGKLSIVGSDEVGTGDYFGPITVVAAFVAKEQIPLLKELGVRDSKNLKDPQIIAIARDLVKTVPYSLLTLPNEKYNQLQRKGYSQGKMKALLHNKAIQHVMQKVDGQEVDGILIDQFAKPDVYFGYLSREKSVVRENVFFETKAEGIHLAVAAASIIARYAFVQHMDNLSEAAGFPIPKGAGKQVDIAAAQIINSKGLQALEKFAKVHFANTDKAKVLAQKAKRP